jgi:DNA recombination protein RmuC
MILSIASSVFFILTLTLLYLYLLSASKLRTLLDKHEELKINHAIISQDLTEYKDKSDKLDKEHNQLLISKTQAETKMKSLDVELKRVNAKLDDEIKLKEQAIDLKNEYQRKESLALQLVKSKDAEMKNWEKVKDEQKKTVTASIMEAGSKLSSKLLDDHRREAENAKKESEKIVKQTTDSLLQQHKGLMESVSTLNEGVKKAEVVHRTLLSPTGAGGLGEITLENIFKNSGLIKGQDYHMQYSVSSESGRGLRPDAVVFLPDDNVMVIDSKASKFYVELDEEIADSEKEKDINARLKRTMNENLKSLASKEYSKAIEDEAGKSLARVYMFLPTEVALEKICKIDPQFIEKAWSQGIYPVGPSGLRNQLVNASMIIANAKQEENAKIIIDKVKELLNSVAILNENANKVGKGLKNALDNYDKFSASFNSNFMSKAKSIYKLGVDSKKIASIEKLPRYEISMRDYKSIEGKYIEQESEQSETEDEKASLELVAQG